MRFREFKVELVEAEEVEIDGEVHTLPSSRMAPKEWDKKISRTTPDPRKYIYTVADGIAKEKTFLWKTGSGKNATVIAGKVDKITTNWGDGGELSAEDWAKWASDVENVSAQDIENSTFFWVDGEEMAPSQMYKTDAATGSLTPNLGDIAEAVLGAAITAKFEQGGANIDAAMIVEILKEVCQAKDKKARRIANYGDKAVANDDVTFYLTLNATSTKGLKIWMREKDPMAAPADFLLVKDFDCPVKTVKGMQEHISNAVKYANTSRRAQVAVDKAMLDPKQNLVEVVSDGANPENQTTTKVDLKILYDGTVTRLLSLKAGSVKQFGQVSGGAFETLCQFFYETVGIQVSEHLKQEFQFRTPVGDKDKATAYYNFGEGPFNKLYDFVAQELKNNVLTNDDTKKEFQLVEKIYNNIVLHATRQEEGVTMVILGLNKSTPYKELAFDTRLYEALTLYDLQMKHTKGTMTIEIYGVLLKDRAAKKLGTNVDELDNTARLITFTTRMSGGAVRNLVEMGDLLKNLADIEKLDAAEAQRQQKQVQQQPAPNMQKPAPEPLNA